MSSDSAPLRDSGEVATDNTSAESAGQPTTPPRITRLAIIVCIGIFLGVTSKNDDRSWDTLAKFGVLPGGAIWSGGYWALVTSAFVHLALWHVAFNVYWLWALGSRLERAIGSLPFLGFVVASAFVSSSFQLALSDNSGIGASGVIYAIFGFMWPTRHRYPQFQERLDARTIQIFFFWLVGCVVATRLKMWNVGNAAHISGLLFGGAVAGSFVLRYRPRVLRAGLAALVLLSLIPLVWCPWSVAWLSLRAYEAHSDGEFEVALKRYTQIIQIDPENAWAHQNRSFVHQALGQAEEARADP